MPATTDRYPVDPGDPGARFEERFRTIEQQLRSILGQNPLNHAVFSGAMRNVDEAGSTVGSWGPDGFRFFDAAGNLLLHLGPTGLRMYDADTEQRVHIGQISSGRYGVLVLDADGTTPRFQVDEAGIRSPYMAAPFVTAEDDYKAVTSGTFVVAHRAQIEQITSEGLYVWVTASTAVGTTGEMRLRNVGTGAVTDAVSIPSGSSGTVQQFRWLHGAQLSAGPVTFEVQARRTAGAGDVNIYRPPGAWMTDPGLCVTDGIA